MAVPVTARTPAAPPARRLCSFSPCIEQVHNVCRALELAGFTDLLVGGCWRGVCCLCVCAPLGAVLVGAARTVRAFGCAMKPAPCARATHRCRCSSCVRARCLTLQTVECLLRSYEVRTERLVPVPKRPTQEGGQQQPAGPPSKRPRVEEGEAAAEGGEEAEEAGCGGDDAAEMKAEVKGEGEEGAQLNGAGGKGQAGGKGGGKGGKQGGRQGGRGGGAAAEQQLPSMVVSCPSVQARGHTGYLTFARKFVGV